MSMPLFERIVQEHAAMGGGPVSLTPVVGDAPLDPHLLKRLRILEACPEIRQESLTTNAIALQRYPDEDVSRLLEAMDCIQVSIGGLDAATHETMYGVNRFPQVQRGLERLLALRESAAAPARITLAFRTDDWKFERRSRRQLEGFRRRGGVVSHIWSYSNYSGFVKSDEKLNLAVVDSSVKMRQACIYARVRMAICWGGRITACGCADSEGDALSIGQAGQNFLAEVWAGKNGSGFSTPSRSGIPLKSAGSSWPTSRTPLFFLPNSTGGSSRTIPSPWNISGSSGEAEELPRFRKAQAGWWKLGKTPNL